MVDSLFYLGLLETLGWFVHWHFDRIVGGGDHNGSHGRVIRAHFLVIDSPVAVEVKRILIAINCLLALKEFCRRVASNILLHNAIQTIPRLVAHTVVNFNVVCLG